MAGENSISLVRVLNTEGATIASIYGIDATHVDGNNWSFSAAKMADVLGHIRDGLSLDVRLIDAKGKKIHYSATVGKTTDDTVTLSLTPIAPKG